MKAKQESIIHSAFDAALYQDGKELRHGLDCAKNNIGFDSMDDVAQLKKLGLNFDMYQSGMDAIQALTTTASVATPIQFVQGWLPGFVRRITAARKIDEIIGITTIGDFSDVQIVQGVVENTGVATVYTDLSDVPLVGYNTNFLYRDTVRFEAGLQVGILEEQQAAKMRVSTAAEKRESATNFVLEVARNQIGFYGYNSGANLTYGFLNDPSLPSYQTVATGAISNSKLWSVKTMLEIQSDILTAIQYILTNSQNVIDPEVTPMTLVTSTNTLSYLNKINDFGISTKNWLNQTYPLIKVKSAPQLNAANSANNVFYLYADKVDDGSSDGGQTFIQMVPTKFMVTGVVKILKGYKESFANATAGVMCKRPYAVYRGSGI